MQSLEASQENGLVQQPSNAFDPMAHAWEPSAADNLNTLIKDCGVSQQSLADILQELPQQAFCDSLIDFYFTSMCVTLECTQAITADHGVYPATGLATLSRNEISELLSLLSGPMGPVVSRTMSVSSPCSLLFSPSPSDWRQNALRETGHPSAKCLFGTTGLVSTERPT